MCISFCPGKSDILTDNRTFFKPLGNEYGTTNTTNTGQAKSAPQKVRPDLIFNPIYGIISDTFKNDRSANEKILRNYAHLLYQ
jgi:hypothetical protein